MLLCCVLFGVVWFGRVLSCFDVCGVVLVCFALCCVVLCFALLWCVLFGFVLVVLLCCSVASYVVFSRFNVFRLVVS